MKKLIYLAGFLFVAGCAPKPAPVTDAWEQERMERIKLDFCMSESQVKEYIRKYIPDVTNEVVNCLLILRWFHDYVFYLVCNYVVKVIYLLS